MALPCAQRVRFVLGEKGLKRGREEKFDADTQDAAQAQDGSLDKPISLAHQERKHDATATQTSTPIWWYRH